MGLAFLPSLQHFAERRLGHVSHDRVRADAAVGFDVAAFLACVAADRRCEVQIHCQFYHMLGFVDSHSLLSQRGRGRGRSRRTRKIYV